MWIPYALCVLSNDNELTYEVDGTFLHTSFKLPEWTSDLKSQEVSGSLVMQKLF